MSQRALQAHADPLLGWTDLNGVGFVVSEVSPYEADLDWSELTEPAEIAPVVDYLGRATAKVHCVADSDADHSLVPFQTEEAIAQVVTGREEEFVAWVVSSPTTTRRRCGRTTPSSSTRSATAVSRAWRRRPSRERSTAGVEGSHEVLD